VGVAGAGAQRRAWICSGISHQGFVQKEKDKQIIKETGRHLAELTKRTLAQKPPTMEPTQKALDAVAQLGDEFQKKVIPKTEAIKDLASMAEEDEGADQGDGPKSVFRRRLDMSRGLLPRGRSVTTGAGSNLCVAVEEPGMGRAVLGFKFPPLLRLQLESTVGVSELRE